MNIPFPADERGLDADEQAQADDFAYWVYEAPFDGSIIETGPATPDPLINNTENPYGSNIQPNGGYRGRTEG